MSTRANVFSTEHMYHGARSCENQVYFVAGDDQKVLLWVQKYDRGSWFLKEDTSFVALHIDIFVKWHLAKACPHA